MQYPWDFVNKCRSRVSKNLSSAGRWISAHTGAAGTYRWLCMNVYLCVTVYLREEHQPAIATFNLVLNSNHIERSRKPVALGSVGVLLQSCKITMYAEPKLSFSAAICLLMLGELPLRKKVAIFASNSMPSLHPEFLADAWGSKRQPLD